MCDVTRLFLVCLGYPGYPHMLISINQTLVTVLLDCTHCSAHLMYMQRDDAKFDIPTFASRVKCNQLICLLVF